MSRVRTKQIDASGHPAPFHCPLHSLGSAATTLPTMLSLAARHLCRRWAAAGPAAAGPAAARGFSAAAAAAEPFGEQLLADEQAPPFGWVQHNQRPSKPRKSGLTEIRWARSCSWRRLRERPCVRMQPPVQHAISTHLQGFLLHSDDAHLPAGAAGGGG